MSWNEQLEYLSDETGLWSFQQLIFINCSNDWNSDILHRHIVMIYKWKTYLYSLTLYNLMHNSLCLYIVTNAAYSAAMSKGWEVALDFCNLMLKTFKRSVKNMEGCEGVWGCVCGCVWGVWGWGYFLCVEVIQPTISKTKVVQLLTSL